MLITRNTNIIDPSEGDMELVMTIKDFPVYMGCVDQLPSKDEFADMNWYISRKTGMVQLNPIVDEKKVYMNPHGSGTVGRLWLQHHAEFAEFVDQHSEGEILEIGSSHGKVYEHIKKGKWTIVEPNYYGIHNEDITIIPEFFHSNLDLGKKFDTIIHSHVLEHVTDLNEFFEGIIKHIDYYGNMIFSVPNMDYIMHQTDSFVLHFEHTYLLKEIYIENILAANGFRLMERRKYGNHSIFYRAIFTGEFNDYDLPDYLYSLNREAALKTFFRTRNDIDQINRDNIRGAYLFGAHVFSQYLLKLGLEENKISCIIDNDTKKHKKRLYGTNLYVKSPEIIAEVDEPKVIVRAGVYTNEIKEQLRRINESCVFI